MKLALRSSIVRDSLGERSMCWMLAVDWTGFGAMLSGGGSIALAWFAFKGLSAWRTQLTGTRKVSVGEDLLTRIYEADTVIEYLLESFVWATELDEIERKPGESDEDYQARRVFEATQRRHNEHIATFTNLRAACFAAKATLGADVYEAAVDVVKLPRRILHAGASAARKQIALNQLSAQRNAGYRISEERWNKAYDDWQKAEDFLYGPEAALDQERRLAVAKVERLVRTAIRGDGKTKE